MLVKLHKGPKHGKTFQVRDGQQEVLLTHYGSAGMLVNWNDPGTTELSIDTRTVRYRMKMMHHPQWGTFPAVNPEGLVYFEYDPS